MGTLVLLLLLSAMSIKQTLAVIKQFRSQSSATQQAVTPVPAHLLKPISHWHLFGAYDPGKLDLKGVPDTSLNLTLVGLIAATPSSASQAIIAISDAQQKVYRKGDTLPGGAKLYKILSDRVILSREGRYEALKLPEQQLNFEPAPRALPVQGNGE